MAVDYQALKNGGFMRQKQKDHFSLRLKVVGGELTSSQLRTIGQVAETFGDGRAHLTARQGVEIPFIKLQDVEAVKKALADGGVETGVCGARARTVTACQGSEICPSGCVDTLSLAQQISRRYYGRVLPHKFKFGVTGCQNNCLKAEENDVGFKGGYLVTWRPEACSFCGVCAKVCRSKAIKVNPDKVLLEKDRCNHCGRCVKSCPTDAWRGQPGYLIYFGGSFGNHIAPGRRLFPLITDPKVALFRADAALVFFDHHGQPGERFRATIDRVGWERLIKMVATQVDDAAETWTGENLSDLANANLANSDQTSSNLANSNQTSFHQANSDRASINLTSVDNNSSLISASLDITDVVCPMTLVKTQVTLADLPEGAILAIRLNEGEPAENLPRSLKDAGHQVLKTRDNGDGSLQLLVQKGARG